MTATTWSNLVDNVGLLKFYEGMLKYLPANVTFTSWDF